MALAIDTSSLLNEFIPPQESHFDFMSGTTGRFKVDRICLHAIVVHDSTVIDDVGDECDEAEQAALDWQADPDDDLEVMEVMHHLTQVAATSPPGRRLLSSNSAAMTTTTLIANVESLTLKSHLQGRPASSFSRFSRRFSFQQLTLRPRWQYSDVLGAVPDVVANYEWAPGCSEYHPGIVLGGNTSGICGVIWYYQVDFVDLLNWRVNPTGSVGKRRQTVNQFHQVPPIRCEQQPSVRAHRPPGEKRYMGVRWRPDRNRWIAEMKPPKVKNKVSLGEFASQTEAARVVDVAFHHYRKRLNFPNITPQTLSTQRTSEGLNADEKLKLVKEQAKWVASTFPPSPASPFPRGTSTIIMSSAPTVEISESSRRRIIAERRSFSGVSSSSRCGTADEADDAVSQPPLRLLPSPMTRITATGAETTEPDLATINHAGVVTDIREGQSAVQLCVEDVMTAPCDIADSYASETATDFLNSPGLEHSSGFQFTWMDHLCAMSPPTALFQTTSPRDFQVDVADRLLEQQNFQGVEWF